MPPPNKLGDEDDDDHRRSLPPPRRSDSDDGQPFCHLQRRHVEVDEQKCSPPDRLRSSTVASKGDTDELVAATLQPSSPLKHSPASVASHQRNRKAHAFGAKDIHSTAVCAQTVPGAVRERGWNQAGSSSPASISGSLDISRHSDSPIVAEVVTTVAAQVVRTEDLEVQVEERFLQRADDIAQQVIQRLRQNAGDDVMQNKSTTSSSTDNDPASQKRKRFMRIFGGCIVAVMVIVAVVVVAVVMTRPSPKPQATTSKPTAAPTPQPRTFLPTTLPPQPLSKMCADFPCSSNLTVLELVNGASNHSLLAGYLTREFNWDLGDYISNISQAITLFAPTDESFRALPPPYSYYVNEEWKLHFWLLLGSHILVQPFTTSQIYQASTLPTFSPFADLSVNQSFLTVENNATIMTADIEASNGYIQIPDRVLIAGRLRHSLRDNVLDTEHFFYSQGIYKFRALLLASGLEDTLQQLLESGLTLFVPSDSAFDELPANVTALLSDNANETTFIQDVVLYHIFDTNFQHLRGQVEAAWVMINNVSAWFTSTNPYNQTIINSATIEDSYVTQNGFMHIINQVLLPPNFRQLLQITTDATTKFNFTSFIGLVEEYAHLGNLFNGVVEGHPELGSYFSGKDYLTLFAPVESAFTESANSSLLVHLWDPSWVLHLQSFCLHHFTLDPLPHFVGQSQLTMLSGFESTYILISTGSLDTSANGTIDGQRLLTIEGSVRSVLYVPKGLIQFIDRVLIPPWANQSVYDVLMQDQNVSSFFDIVQLSNWTGLLNVTDGPYTVFAPNNEAMAKLRNSASFSWQEWVMSHVVRGNVYMPSNGNLTLVSLANQTILIQAAKVGNLTTITTVVGVTASIAQSSFLTFNGSTASIVQANVLASNGVVHVIGRVIFVPF